MVILVNLYYTIDKKKLATVNKSCCDAKTIFEGGQLNLEAARYLLKELFGVNSFSVNLLKQDKCYELVTGMAFTIESDKGNFGFYFEDDDLKLLYKNESYIFHLSYAYPNNILRLKELAYYAYDRSIIERFDTHKMELEVHFKQNNKVHYLEVPMDRDMTFDLGFCRMLKPNFSIMDLRKFYRKMFYPNQGEYDRINSLTTLSIWKKHDMEDGSLEKGFKLDQLVLQDDYIQSWQLGSYFITQDGEPIVVTLKDGVYTINGLDKEEDSIDFNKVISDLRLRKRNLK